MPKAMLVITPTSTVDARVPIITGCSHCLIMSLGLTIWTDGTVVVADVVVVVVDAIQKSKYDKDLISLDAEYSHLLS